MPPETKKRVPSLHTSQTQHRHEHPWTPMLSARAGPKSTTSSAPFAALWPRRAPSWPQKLFLTVELRILPAFPQWAPTTQPSGWRKGHSWVGLLFISRTWILCIQNSQALWKLSLQLPHSHHHLEVRALLPESLGSWPCDPGVILRDYFYSTAWGEMVA